MASYVTCGQPGARKSSASRFRPSVSVTSSRRRCGSSAVATPWRSPSPKHHRLLKIVEDLDRRGVGLVMLSMGGQQIDTRSPTRKLMATMLAAIAEFERGLLLERQREGRRRPRLTASIGVGSLRRGPRPPSAEAGG